MKKILASLLLVLFITVLPPSSARADGGGWPTATPTVTPTITPTYTPVPPTAVPPTPTSPYPYPAINSSSSSMITPPALTPLSNPAVTPISDAAALSSELLPSPTSTPRPSTSITTGIACLPIAIVALLIGIAMLNWLRAGMQKGT